MEMNASNIEVGISVAITNLSTNVFSVIQQYDQQVSMLRTQVESLTKERDSLRAENDTLHTQINQSEPDPLTEK